MIILHNYHHHHYHNNYPVQSDNGEIEDHYQLLGHPVKVAICLKPGSLQSQNHSHFLFVIITPFYGYHLHHDLIIIILL